MFSDEMLWREATLRGCGLKRVTDFPFHAQDVCELEIASLVLESAWAAAPDKPATGMNEPADFAHDFRVGPPASAAPGGFGIAIVDDDPHVFRDSGFFNFRKAEELGFDRQAGEAFQKSASVPANNEAITPPEHVDGTMNPC
jgi:hypothetical protein